MSRRERRIKTEVGQNNRVGTLRALGPIIKRLEAVAELNE